MSTIGVMSGGAPKEIFAQLTPAFEKKSGHKVEFIFEVMSALRDRLAKGEKTDLLVMPTNILDSYEKAGVVRRQDRAVLGLVSINAVVRAGAPTPDLSTPDQVRKTILASRAIVHAPPGATPSGTHMGKLIEQLGIAGAMASKIVHRPALAGGVETVASGEADIGFFPKSEVIGIGGLSVAGSLPSSIQLTTIYGAAVTTASVAPDAAAEFIAFVTDRAHQPQWAKAGFDPPPT